jgi:Ferredoxin-thioredoxin reductase, catalytic subunit
MQIQGWRRLEADIGEMRTFMQAWADLYGYTLNPDERRCAILIKYMLLREADFGNWYCPSEEITGDPTLDNTIVCPCTLARDEIDTYGSCGCGLFQKRKL